MEIYIMGERIGIQPAELQDLLINTMKTNDDVKMELRKSEIVLRGVDPTILVAIVGTIGTGLGALITGLLQIAKQKAAQKMTVQSGDNKIEVPQDISPEMLDALIDKIKKLDAENLRIALS